MEEKHNLNNCITVHKIAYISLICCQYVAKTYNLCLPFPLE